jgi:hypothetical protein
MATYYWVANTSHGYWDTSGGNYFWSLSSGGAGQSNAPQATDLIIFDGGGIGDCTWSLSNPIGVNELRMIPGYTGAFRLSGSSTRFSIVIATTLTGGSIILTSGAIVTILGTGSTFYQNGTTISVDSTSKLRLLNNGSVATTYEFHSGTLSGTGTIRSEASGTSDSTVKFGSGMSFPGSLYLYQNNNPYVTNIYPGGILLGAFKSCGVSSGARIFINPGEELITAAFNPFASEGSDPAADSHFSLDSIGSSATHYFTLMGGGTLTGITSNFRIKNSLAVNSTAPIYALGGTDVGGNDKYWVFNQYTITASSGAHGSIAPSGAVVVDGKWDKTFNATPSGGYYCSSYTVDGGDVAGASSYTFTNVLAAHTIVANFSLNPRSTFLTQRQQLALKLESVEGTDSIPTSSDVIAPVYSPDWTPNIKFHERTSVLPSFSKLTQVPSEKSATIKFECEVKGSGTAGSPPSFGQALKACGWAETIVGGTSVTYKPSSLTTVPSCTIEIRESNDSVWKSKKIVGARGTVSMDCANGCIVRLKFSFTGKYVEPTDTVAFTQPSPGINPPAFLNASISLLGVGTLRIPTFSMDAGNTVTLRPDATIDGGYFCGTITNRKMTGSIDPEQEIISVINFPNQMTTPSQGVLFWNIGSTAGNRIAFSAPKSQIIGIAEADRSGIRAEKLSIAFGQNASTGDDEASLVFT